ncbi:MAG TPA: hypothetical protein VGG28_32415 [Kofleriaceae bacterium]|jgi:hypothetical protein
MHWLVALGLVAACSDSSGIDGVYVGSVAFSGMAGDCVPSQLTLSFQRGTLVSVDGGSSTFGFPSSSPGDEMCTATVTDGNGDVTCQYFEGDGSGACGSVLGERGTTTLTLSDDALTGDITTDVSLKAPSTNCVQQTECSGTGTVTFAKQ